jgi:hypothetical protein
VTSDTSPIHVGNAGSEGAARRGWIIGHFLPEGDPRRSTDVEIKWGVHPAGDERTSRSEVEHRTTVVLLASGRFEVLFDTRVVELREPGDYAMWGRGVGHSWRAVEDSVVVTIRWPSTP